MLGSGSVESTRYYYFMKSNNDGSYSESRVIAQDSKIFEDADSLNQPYVVRTYIYKVFTSLKYFILPSSKGTVSVEGTGCSCSGNNKVEIHVPKGTIIQEYQIKF
jgi:hypothetical protein